MFAPDHQPRCFFIATSLQPTHKVAAIPIKAKRGEEETGKSRMFTYVQHAQDKAVESRSGQGAEKYFDVALKTGDYYTKGIGTWGGRGGELSGGRLMGRRPFKPSMLARAYRIATLLNPIKGPLIKDSQTIKEVVNRIV